MKRLLLLSICGVTGAATLLALVQPINSTVGRALALGSALAFFGSLLLLAWKTRPLRVTFLASTVLLVGLVLLPGRAFDPSRLQMRYAEALKRYSGVPYVWGGEGRMGIDCSGLPRKALRDALWSEGLWTLNGTLLREAIGQWWFDASARALAEGYRDGMRPLFSSPALRRADFASLEPGDVAITKSGVHCLVYLRNDTWIQADPGVGRVAEFDARKTDNAWFDEPVGVYRWTVFNARANRTADGQEGGNPTSAP